MTKRFCHFDSPLGRLILAGTASGLERIDLPAADRPAAPQRDWILDEAAFSDARRQLHEYFDGRRRRFDLDLAPHGTEFQLRVWRTLAEIPYGATWSYAELAARIGRPRAVRAVGRANGANPLPIVLPCHRVIGADGSLTGYGGGLEAKRFLLALEGGIERQARLLP